jgi:hypothetical protein
MPADTINRSSMRTTHSTLKLGLLATVSVAAGLLHGAEPPTAEISNGQIKAKIYLPDASRGFYRTTRFDWSGIIGSLTYKGHEFYAPWYYRVDPTVYDLAYDDKGVISAPFTAMIGPGEEFGGDGGALGFAEAKPGGTFIKIGVGVLRKPQAGEPPVPVRPARGPSAPQADPDRYDHSRTYELVDSGKWDVKKKADFVEFTQTLTDPSSGYAYLYQKTVRLVPGKPQMLIQHSLKNTGTKTINSNVYNHNFLVIDNEGPSKDFTITAPFQMEPTRPPTAGLLEIQGNKLVYVKTLTGEERATAGLKGYGETPKDYDFRVENRKLGVGYHVTADRPLSNLAVWSIRTVNALEPYVAMTIDPGKEFTWNLTYEYFANAPAK